MHVYKKSFFRGVFACDDLPRNFALPAAFIINLSKKSEAGSHWVALCIDRFGVAYYFDSFGLPPKNVFIKQFIKMHSKKLVFNKTQLQHITSSKCGKYCCVFVVVFLKNLSFPSLLRKFSLNLSINEIIIERLFNYYVRKTTHF